MHTQHLIGRVKQIQTDLRSMSDELQVRGYMVMAEELRSEAKSMEGVLIALHEDLTAERARAAENYSGVRCMCVLTGCRAGPGCPRYCDHCKDHIAHVERVGA